MLHEFLSYYLPNENTDAIVQRFHERSIARNELLLRPGMACDYLAYIEEGVFRVFYLDRDGREVTTWFSFPGMVITDMLGYYTNGRAAFHVEALQAGILHVISKQDLDELYKAHPPYREFGRKFAEEALTMLMQRTMSLHTLSAEERYAELLREPAFMQHIPLKHLASYLGITDTSLSRIRRKVR